MPNHIVSFQSVCFKGLVKICDENVEITNDVVTVSNKWGYYNLFVTKIGKKINSAFSFVYV